ncbi:MAG: alpha-amylase family glycosyl hydrolase [Xenococcaceae cyanobacterium]
MVNLPTALAAEEQPTVAVNFQQPAVERQNKTRGNLENDVLYYIVVDRFLDAEPENNIPGFAFADAPSLEDPEKHLYNEMNKLLLRHTYDPTHTYMAMYWGGDLKGVIQKLDYLQDLGVTKIILSPIQDNANGIFYHTDINNYLHHTKEDAGRDNFYRSVSTAYHGYWTKDWFEIDEHFRQPEDETGDDRYEIFRQLLNEAGKRGIGVILDITLNQTSPGHISTEPPELGAGGFLFGESWFADNGNVYRHGELVGTHWDPKTGERDPQGWFHPPKIIWDFGNATQELIEEGQISGGMPDLNHEAPQVEKYFLDAARFWSTFNSDSYPIAGFRLDAVKHVNASFWRKFEKTVLDINPDTILIGEYFSGGYRHPPSIEFLKKTENITQFDFNLSEATRRFFAQDRGWDGRAFMLEQLSLGRKGIYYNYGPVERIFNRILNPAETLQIPRSSLDAVSDEEARGWVTFVENHDQPRVKTFYPDMSDEAYSSLIKFQFAARGVPLVMYGTETGLAVPYHPEHQGLFGVGGDPFNRPMMIWPKDPGWKQSIYKATKNMAHLRRQYPVLRYGETRFLHPKSSSRDQDIFMLREPQSCEPSGDELSTENLSECARILYAYSTNGGKFLVDLSDEEIRQYEVVETAEKGTTVNGGLNVELQPEQARVFVLK